MYWHCEEREIKIGDIRRCRVYGDRIPYDAHVVILNIDHTMALSIHAYILELNEKLWIDWRWTFNYTALMDDNGT